MSKSKYLQSKTSALIDNELAHQKDLQNQINNFNTAGKNKVVPYGKQPINKTQYIPSKLIPKTVCRYKDTNTEL